MTVYNVNLGIGWASSGVEYAQKYRDQSFKQVGIKAKFIFSDLILENNIEELTANLGFEDSSIIWLYNFFTDIKIAPTSYSLNDLEDKLGLKTLPKKVSETGNEVFYLGQNDLIIVAHFNNKERKTVDQVVYRRKNTFLKKEYYSYTNYVTEYYEGKTEDNGVVFREFYNEDGSIAYTQHLNNNKEIFEFADGKILYSKDELYLAMLKKLNFTKDDVILLDREDEDKGLINGQLIFQNHGAAKIVVIVHADHYDKHFTDKHHILWNNFYEYQFSHAKEVASFVVATPTQKKVLEDQFKKYYGFIPRIDCIPVGSLLKLAYPIKERKKFSLITASRLAKEKHLDWLVKAVIAAKNQVPELTLDIYGKGSQAGVLTNIINNHGAQQYIRLMGQRNLTDVYANYQGYIAASTSEGFGLSLLEAIGSGLAMIGFNVPYGNPTFIENGKNGFLLPYNEDWNEFKKIELLTQAIIKLFRDSNLEEFSQKSYEIANSYLTKKVATKWRKLVEELVND